MPIPLVRLNARISRTYMPSKQRSEQRSCLQLSGVGIYAGTSNVVGFALDGSNFHSSIVSRKLMNNCATKLLKAPDFFTGPDERG